MDLENVLMSETVPGQSWLYVEYLDRELKFCLQGCFDRLEERNGERYVVFANGVELPLASITKVMERRVVIYDKT